MGVCHKSTSNQSKKQTNYKEKEIKKEEKNQLLPLYNIDSYIKITSNREYHSLYNNRQTKKISNSLLTYDNIQHKRIVIEESNLKINNTSVNALFIIDSVGKYSSKISYFIKKIYSNCISHYIHKVFPYLEEDVANKESIYNILSPLFYHIDNALMKSSIFNQVIDYSYSCTHLRILCKNRIVIVNLGDIVSLLCFNRFDDENEEKEKENSPPNKVLALNKLSYIQEPNEIDYINNKIGMTIPLISNYIYSVYPFNNHFKIGSLSRVLGGRFYKSFGVNSHPEVFIYDIPYDISPKLILSITSKGTSGINPNEVLSIVKQVGLSYKLNESKEEEKKICEEIYKKSQIKYMSIYDSYMLEKRKVIKHIKRHMTSKKVMNYKQLKKRIRRSYTHKLTRDLKGKGNLKGILKSSLKKVTKTLNFMNQSSVVDSEDSNINNNENKSIENIIKDKENNENNENIEEETIFEKSDMTYLTDMKSTKMNDNQHLYLNQFKEYKCNCVFDKKISPEMIFLPSNHELKGSVKEDLGIVITKFI